MTNSEIIFKAAIAANLYTEEEALAIVAAEGDLPIHTYAEWQRMGRQVRLHEQAALVCDLWKYTRKPNKAARAAAEAEGKDPAENPHYYKALSRLFTKAQTDRKQDPEEARRAAMERVRAINAELSAQRHGKRKAEQPAPEQPAPTAAPEQQPDVWDCEQIPLF